MGSKNNETNVNTIQKGIQHPEKTLSASGVKNSYWIDLKLLTRRCRKLIKAAQPPRTTTLPHVGSRGGSSRSLSTNRRIPGPPGSHEARSSTRSPRTRSASPLLQTSPLLRTSALFFRKASVCRRRPSKRLRKNARAGLAKWSARFSML